MTVWMCLHCGEQHQLAQQCLTEYLIVLWKKQKINLKRNISHDLSVMSSSNQASPSAVFFTASPLAVSFLSSDYYTTLYCCSHFGPHLGHFHLLGCFPLDFFSKTIFLLEYIHTALSLLFNSMSLSHLSLNSSFFPFLLLPLLVSPHLLNTNFIAAILQKCHWWCVITAVCYTGSLFYLTTTVYHFLSAAVVSYSSSPLADWLHVQHSKCMKWQMIVIT